MIHLTSNFAKRMPIHGWRPVPEWRQTSLYRQTYRKEVHNDITHTLPTQQTRKIAFCLLRVHIELDPI